MRRTMIDGIAADVVNRFSGRPRRPASHGGVATPLRVTRTSGDPSPLMTIRVALLAAECEPWAKTGGLADVVDALARALGRLPEAGTELQAPVDVFLPRYRLRAGARRRGGASRRCAIAGPARRHARAVTLGSSTWRPTATGCAWWTCPAAFDRDALLRPPRRPVAVRGLLPGGPRRAQARRHAARRPPRPRLAHRPRAARAGPRRGGRRPVLRRHGGHPDAPQPRLPRLDAARRGVDQLGLAPGDAAGGPQPGRRSTCC